MLWFIPLILGLSLCFSPLAQGFFAMSQIFQGVCLLHAPSSPWEEYYRAVVCGVSLEPSIEKSLLVDLGLIHIIVVSGSHLVFLSRILKEGMKLSWGTFIFLLIFVAMTGMEPPVVRAFVSLTLSLLVKRFKLFYSPYAIALLSVLVCLGLFPQWVSSPSLPLSWGASLAIALGRNAYSQSFLCYCLLAPLISSWTLYCPGTILINTFLTPLVSYLLFPASLLSYLLPLTSVTDFMWQGLFEICQNLSFIKQTSYITLNEGLESRHQWLYLITVNLLCMELYRRKKI